MSKTVNLGGDRLGSGNKMNVELNGFQRSNHDLSYTFKTTMAAGTLVPFMHLLGLPGDTFDIDLDCVIKTHPTIGPLFDTYKIQLDVFKCDWRLYMGKLHNNKLRVGLNIGQLTLPIMKLYAFKSTNNADDLSTSQINPSCILSYFDIRGVGRVDDAAASTAFVRNFPALKLLSYWDIYKNYYANKQELEGCVIHNTRPVLNSTITSITVVTPPSSTAVTIPDSVTTPAAVPVGLGSQLKLNYTGAVPNPETVMILVAGIWMPLLSLFGSTTVTATHVLLIWNGTSSATTIEQWKYTTSSDVVPAPPSVVRFPLENLDTMRESILAGAAQAATFNLNDEDLTPYSYIANFSVPTTDYELNYSLNQEGLGIKTYQSDLHNNWLRTEDISGPNGISEITAIAGGGDITVDQLNIQQKVYRMLSKIVAAGNSYDDYIDAVYAHRRFGKPEIPVYCGGLSKELVFQEVISNAETADQPLGTLAGRGVMGAKHKGGKLHIKVDEFCYLIGIVSLTPRIVYSQGNAPDNDLLSIDDVHKPDLDAIGYQGLMGNHLAWWDAKTTTGTWSRSLVGYQPAWTHYMSNINKTYGNFALPNNEMFMTLNRRYEYDTVNKDIRDLTTYIDPAKFNHIFAQTSLDAMNFWTQIRCDIVARRVMSAKQIPNL